MGWIGEDGGYKAYDRKNYVSLDPRDAFDKIKIYEDQVNGWFLERAAHLVPIRSDGFIVLMICVSYLEGVEEYGQGVSSVGRSKEFFRLSIQRIYPDKFTQAQIDRLYSQARCGLFHTGMVKGDVLIDREYSKALEFIDEDIKINPEMLLNDVKNDFKGFIVDLRTSAEARDKFDRMFSVLPTS